MEEKDKSVTVAVKLKKYYVTCIVCKANQEMTFVNDLIEYAQLTEENIQAFQQQIVETIYKREKALTKQKIINVVLNAFSELGD